jgi:hypothetical protein
VDATTGATLWTVTPPTSGGLRATAFYDATTNLLHVATTSNGVAAYDLGTATPAVAPAAAAGWANPGGAYRQGCNRFAPADALACVDTAGQLRLLHKTTGAVLASVSTGVSSPSMLWPVGGASPGFVLGSATRVARVTATPSPPALAVVPGGFAPSGFTISPVQVRVSDGAIYVGGSDKQVHKLRLSDAGDTGLSVSITSQAASVQLAIPAYDVVGGRLVFGTDDGRLWAVPKF